MNKKGDMTINIIIVAVIALLVMIILVYIFSGKMGIFSRTTGNETTKTCRGQLGGSVVPFDQDCEQGNTESIGAYTDVPAGFKCCIMANP